ncbi:MAG: hypothetical protein EOO24_07660 [Comamonadaceae bacterium]|nr:MAG: hypothetical protein EOO24_07660 [Comamonadaceae bacterium]
MQATLSRSFTMSRQRPYWLEKPVSLGRTGASRPGSEAEQSELPCAADSVFKRFPAIGDIFPSSQKQG